MSDDGIRRMFSRYDRQFPAWVRNALRQIQQIPPEVQDAIKQFQQIPPEVRHAIGQYQEVPPGVQDAIREHQQLRQIIDLQLHQPFLCPTPYTPGHVTPSVALQTPPDVHIQEQHPGVQIRKARKGRHWSQEQLAKKSGVSRRTISSLESGRRTPRNELLNYILSALALPPAQ